jgi:DNA polymerase-3 subunit alpha
VREVVTKNGDRMGFMTLEDLKGTVQVIVFSELYKRSLTLLAGQEPLLVRGHADVGEESVKVIAREIGPLRGIVIDSPREVHVHLSSQKVSREQLERLKSLLSRHRGASHAFIHLKEEAKGETILSLSEELRVEASRELAQEVDSLFGSSVTTLQ